MTVPEEQYVFGPPNNDGGARVLWSMPGEFFAFASSADPGYSLVAPWVGGG